MFCNEIRLWRMISLCNCGLDNGKFCPRVNAGGRLTELHKAVGDRMGKPNPVRPEGNGAAVFQSTVFPFAYQRKLTRGKLHPNLVSAPGLQVDADKGMRPGGVKSFIIQKGFLHALSQFLYHESLTLELIPQKEIAHGTGPGSGASVANCQILLLEPVLPDLTGKVGGCLGIFCQHHETTDHLIQTVDRSEFGMGIAKGFPEKIGQTARLICGADSRRLDADDQMIILIDQINHKHLVPFLFYGQYSPLKKRKQEGEME